MTALPDDLLTLREAAVLLGVGYTAVLSAIRDGRLHPLARAADDQRPGHWRLRRADVAAYAARRRWWRCRTTGWRWRREADP